MLKQDVIRSMAEIAGSTQVESSRQLDAFYETLSDFFRDGGASFRLGRFGVLKLAKRQPRQVRNIHTKELMTVPEHYTVTFSPSEDTKESVNN